MERSVHSLDYNSSRQIDSVEVCLFINSKEYYIQVEPWMTLLDAIREVIGLHGTKKGCDHGQCGACTILMNGQRILSCLSLAIMSDRKTITTIEGLEQDGILHPLQTAFITHDAFQCGYCTPGQIVSALGLLSEPGGKSDREVKEAMSGNICRCGAYPNIIAAIQAVRKEESQDVPI